LIFDPEVAATMPVRMTPHRILGLSLAKRLEFAAREHRTPVPSDLIHNVSGPAVAVSPNGKEMVMTARRSAIHNPDLPDTSFYEQRELELRKRQ
jgi:hypothetical protein